MWCWRARSTGLFLAFLVSPVLAGAADPERGRNWAHSRSVGLCVLCHAFPGVPNHLAGTLGPDLGGVASRLTPDLLRARVLFPDRFNPATIMPRYGTDKPGQERVAPARVGQPLLSPAQLEDVLAYLETLK